MRQAFNLSRAEALATDPQQRVLLEEVHAALRDGQHATGPLFGTETGMRVDRLTPFSNNISVNCAQLVLALLPMVAGVYVGCMNQEYYEILALAGMQLSSAAATGNSLAFMVGRVSYSFGLAG